MNGEKWKRFINEFSFWKFIITMLFFGVVFFVQMDRRIGAMEDRVVAHLQNGHVHLDDNEEYILRALVTNGMGSGAMAKLIELDKKVSALELEWKIAKEQGRLQTPSEKEEIIRKVLRDYLNESAKNDK
jgi:hypothetical protein